MSTRTESRPWDFSNVLDLVNSLEHRNVAVAKQSSEAIVGFPLSTPLTGKAASNGIGEQDFATPPPTQLGDFAKVWQFLGSPLNSPAPDVPALTNEQAANGTNMTAKVDYASDGAAYFHPTRNRKGVKWQDQQAVDERANDTLSEHSASPDTPDSPTLTKAQRKKQRRKERKAKEEEEAKRAATVSESEVDSITRRTPARKASAHSVADNSAKRYELRTRDASGKALTSPAPAFIPPPNQPSDPAQTSSITDIETARARVAEKLNALRKPPSENVAPSKQAPSTPSKKQMPATPADKQAPSTPHANGNSGSAKKPLHPSSAPVIQRTTSANDVNHHQNSNVQQNWPVPTRQDASRYQQSTLSKFVPSTVKPPLQPAAQPSIMSQVAAPSTAMQSPNTPSGRAKPMIEPKIVRSGEDRHWALLMKLIADFYEDRKHILLPMTLTTHNNDPKGIHVFVDASNIFIGFTDQLKRSRGIPQYTHVPQVNLSFDALALLMERRRPVAKRVLAGSTPHLPAFDKAEAVGYECSILEKVYKARELTERQIYFKEHDRFGRDRKGAKAPPANTVASVNTAVAQSHGGVGGGSGSGSEMNAPQYAPARMIEQGVDEILHLKILESVVDTETPSTIVLATGDAAQAEYSQGFMAMIERALKKGWKVELVSWSKNISMLYRRPEWVQAWGANFRVVYLDDYAEELLDM